jgi:hypothetical protein
MASRFHVVAGRRHMPELGAAEAPHGGVTAMSSEFRAVIQVDSARIMAVADWLRVVAGVDAVVNPVVPGSGG